MSSSLEAIAAYLVFLAGTFYAAFLLTEYMPPSAAYGAAAVCALMQVIFGSWYFSLEERSLEGIKTTTAKVLALTGVGGSVLVIICGMAARFGHPWPLICAAVGLVLFVLYKTASRREKKIYDAGFTPAFPLATFLLYGVWTVPLGLVAIFVVSHGGLLALIPNGWRP